MPVPVYLEVGRRRVFASALEWPGWCRSGRDETAALAALAAYAGRYAAAVADAGVEPPATAGPEAFEVVERVTGGSGTDFGAPEVPAGTDGEPLGAALERWCAVLVACWAALDRAASSNVGRTLSTGPRGGGRSLDGVVTHVVNAERAYLSRLGGARLAPSAPAGELHAAVLDALAARDRGDTPERGPRGGLRWTARYGARRVAWHVLDHAWEIEDRAGG